MNKSLKDIIVSLFKTGNISQFVKECYGNNVVRYIFFGVLTTLVNFGVFALFKDVFKWQVLLSNTLSVSIAILFAYYVNAKFVFCSKASDYKTILKELSTFVSARLITMLIEIFGVELLADVLKIDVMISKVLINIIVLVLNYVFSALIFKKK